MMVAICGDTLDPIPSNTHFAHRRDTRRTHELWCALIAALTCCGCGHGPNAISQPPIVQRSRDGQREERCQTLTRPMCAMSSSIDHECRVAFRALTAELWDVAQAHAARCPPSPAHALLTIILRTDPSFPTTDAQERASRPAARRQQLEAWLAFAPAGIVPIMGQREHALAYLRDTQADGARGQELLVDACQSYLAQRPFEVIMGSSPCAFLDRSNHREWGTAPQVERLVRSCATIDRECVQAEEGEEPWAR